MIDQTLTWPDTGSSVLSMANDEIKFGFRTHPAILANLSLPEQVDGSTCVPRQVNETPPLPRLVVIEQRKPSPVAREQVSQRWASADQLFGLRLTDGQLTGEPLDHHCAARSAGVFVSSVQPNSLARAKAIQPGDQVLAINGQPLIGSGGCSCSLASNSHSATSTGSSITVTSGYASFASETQNPRTLSAILDAQQAMELMRRQQDQVRLLIQPAIRLSAGQIMRSNKGESSACGNQNGLTNCVDLEGRSSWPPMKSGDRQTLRLLEMGPTSGEHLFEEVAQEELPDERKFMANEEELKLLKEFQRFTDEYLSEIDKTNLSNNLNEFETGLSDLSELLSNLMQNVLSKLPNSMIKFKLLSYIKKLYLNGSGGHQNGSLDSESELEGKLKLDLRLFDAVAHRYLLSSYLMLSSNDTSFDELAAPDCRRKRPTGKRSLPTNSSARAAIASNHWTRRNGRAGDQIHWSDGQPVLRNLSSGSAASDCKTIDWRKSNSSIDSRCQSSFPQTRIGMDQENGNRSGLNTDSLIDCRQEIADIIRPAWKRYHFAGGLPMDESQDCWPTLCTSNDMLDCRPNSCCVGQLAANIATNLHLDEDNPAIAMAPTTSLDSLNHLSHLKLAQEEQDQHKQQHHHHHQQQQLQLTHIDWATNEALTEPSATSEPADVYPFHPQWPPMRQRHLTFADPTKGDQLLGERPSWPPRAATDNRLAEGSPSSSDSHDWIRQLSALEQPGKLHNFRQLGAAFRLASSERDLASFSALGSDQSSYLKQQQPESFLAASSRAVQSNSMLHECTWPQSAPIGELVVGQNQLYISSNAGDRSTQVLPLLGQPSSQAHLNQNQFRQQIQQQYEARRAARHSSSYPEAHLAGPKNGRQVAALHSTSMEVDDYLRYNHQVAPVSASVCCPQADEHPNWRNVDDSIWRQSAPIEWPTNRSTGPNYVYETKNNNNNNNNYTAKIEHPNNNISARRLNSIYQRGPHNGPQTAFINATSSRRHFNVSPAGTKSLPSSPIGHEKLGRSSHQQRRQRHLQQHRGDDNNYSHVEGKDRQGRRKKYDHEDEYEDEDEEEEDEEEEETDSGLSLVAAPAGLPKSVAEQMREQANNFVHRHGSASSGRRHGHGQANKRRRPKLQVRRTLRVRIKKSKPILGIAIEGGFNVSGQLLPRIVCVHEDGAAYRCGKLRASDLILEVNGTSTVNMTHEQIASTIADAYYRDPRAYIEFLVGESIDV